MCVGFNHCNDHQLVILNVVPSRARNPHHCHPDPTKIPINFTCLQQISNVGYEHVDRKTVSDAVAGHTLFIHGSSVDGGNLAILRAATTPPEGEIVKHFLCRKTERATVAHRRVHSVSKVYAV